jgi:hypothetical protein
MSETPRTWTLKCSNGVLTADQDPDRPLPHGAAAKTYEASTVDAEREQMLDLLEQWWKERPLRRLGSSRGRQEPATETILREHGRLKEN